MEVVITVQYLVVVFLYTSIDKSSSEFFFFYLCITDVT